MFDVAENKKISNNIPVMAGEWTNKRLACLQFSAWRALYFPFVQRQFYLSLSLSSFLCLSLSLIFPRKYSHCPTSSAIVLADCSFIWDTNRSARRACPHQTHTKPEKCVLYDFLLISLLIGRRNNRAFTTPIIHRLNMWNYWRMQRINKPNRKQIQFRPLLYDYNHEKLQSDVW